MYIFLDINHAITRGLHRPGSRGGGGGLFKICITGNNLYKILGIIMGCFVCVCVFQKSSPANDYIVEYIIPTEKYIANTNTFMSDRSISESIIIVSFCKTFSLNIIASVKGAGISTVSSYLTLPKDDIFLSPA